MSAETIVSVLVGGAITFGASWFFYVRAARELKAETSVLRRRIESVLYGLEDAGIVRLSKNEAGEVEGVLIAVGKSVGLLWDVEAPTQRDEDSETGNGEKP